MYEIVEISTIKNRKHEDFKKFGWKVKVKDTDTNKKLNINFLINKIDNTLYASFASKKNQMIYSITDRLTEIYEDVAEDVINYLLNNQEVYIGEDGDYYLIGEE